MARIAEELLLLLLDNAAARPALDRSRRQRMLAGAVLLDLAQACHVLRVIPDDPDDSDRLVAVLHADTADPVSAQAWHVLDRKPLRVETALGKLSRWIEPALLTHLEQTGQVHRLAVYGKRGRPRPAYPLTDRTRVAGVRAVLQSVLFDGVPPDPGTAALITLLHAGAGLDAVVSLDQRAWGWADERAGDISAGTWITEDSDPAAINVAVIGAAIRAALEARTRRAG